MHALVAIAVKIMISIYYDALDDGCTCACGCGCSCACPCDDNVNVSFIVATEEGGRTNLCWCCCW